MTIWGFLGFWEKIAQFQKILKIGPTAINYDQLISTVLGLTGIKVLTEITGLTGIKGLTLRIKGLTETNGLIGIFEPISNNYKHP